MQWGIVLAGDWKGESDSAETTNDGTVFDPLTDLPNANGFTCMAIIDDDRLFVTGGSNNPTETFIFSQSQNFWFRYCQLKNANDQTISRAVVSDLLRQCSDDFSANFSPH